jgi:hypothetical protein
MNPNGGAGLNASDIAEQILQKIYGDDFAGCNIAPDEIASVIETALEQQRKSAVDLLDLYEKVIEAIVLLSTPPEAGKIADPAELGKTLSERLDAIHAVATKTRDTVAKFRSSTT